MVGDMTGDWAHLGVCVLQRRKSLGWSRNELAGRAKVSARTIGTLERGLPISKTNAGLVVHSLGWTYDSARIMLNGGQPVMRNEDDDKPRTIELGTLDDGSRVLFTHYGELTDEDKKAAREFVEFLHRKSKQDKGIGTD